MRTLLRSKARGLHGMHPCHIVVILVTSSSPTLTKKRALGRSFTLIISLLFQLHLFEFWVWLAVVPRVIFFTDGSTTLLHVRQLPT